MMNRRKRTIMAAIGAVSALGIYVAAGSIGVANATGSDNEVGSSRESGHSHGDSDSNSELEVLGSTCEGNSSLSQHSGFQSDEAVCVPTEFGEQSAFEDNPTLLITGAPIEVEVGEDIVIEVSTRNLVRDRFLAAGQGGYYLESAFLNEDGLTRGHFHTGCRKIGDEAPEPLRLDSGGVNRFVATEDGEGSDDSDTVKVTVKGFKYAGVVQCAAWAGDGSHRIPMMAFANVVPAFDAVRITVVDDGDDK